MDSESSKKFYHIHRAWAPRLASREKLPLRKKVLKSAASRANIQGQIGSHTLRHSYSTWLDETGVPFGVRQKLMRHANISTTMNVYGGAFMETKRKANTSVVQRVLVQDRTK